MSAAFDTGAFAKTSPVAGFIKSCVLSEDEATLLPLMKFCRVFKLNLRVVDVESLVREVSFYQEFLISAAANWPHAPSISRPLVSRTVTGTP